MKAIGLPALVLAGLVLTRPCPAQEIGARVRVTGSSLPGGSATGRLVHRTSDTLFIAGDSLRPGQTAVAIRDVSALEVSRGRHGHALRGAGIGALVGGAAFGLALATQCQDTDLASSEGCAGVTVGLGVFGGGLVGLVVGALVVTERWESLPPPRVAVEAVPTTHGMAVTLLMRF